MDKLKTGGQAFPRYEARSPEGMTLRDYFAAKAMQGWVTDGRFRFETDQIAEAAEFAYTMADAMLAARGNRNGT